MTPEGIRNLQAGDVNDDDDVDIIATLEAELEFGTLLSALQVAGLTEMLRSANSITLFAPTDEAFNKLGASALNALLADPNQLANILLYHTVEGTVLHTDLMTGPVATLQGSTIDVVVSTPSLPLSLARTPTITVNGVPIEDADDMATNGVIHELDSVLMPPLTGPTMAPTPTTTMFKVLQRNPRFSFLVDALFATGLDATLDSPTSGGSLTLFAPDNKAFAMLGADTLEALFEALAGDLGALTDLMRYHVLNGTISSSSFETRYYRTLSGDWLEVEVELDGDIELNDNTTVVVSDIGASNGIIHEINMVLFPKLDDDVPGVDTAVDFDDDEDSDDDRWNDDKWQDDEW